MMKRETDINIKKLFGLSVLHYRNKLGISQEELAARSGLHRTYIGDIERGKRNIGLENIGRLAAALETTASNLLSDIKLPKRD